jgi:hypothetical protein
MPHFQRSRKLTSTSHANRKNRNIPWNTAVAALGRLMLICAVSPPM